MATAWFPIDKASEAGNIFIEVSKKFPNDRSLSKLLLNNAIATTKEGYKSVTASEIKEGKLNDNNVLKAKNVRLKFCPQLLKQWMFWGSRYQNKLNKLNFVFS